MIHAVLFASPHSLSQAFGDNHVLRLFTNSSIFNPDISLMLCFVSLVRS